MRINSRLIAQRLLLMDVLVMGTWVPPTGDPDLLEMGTWVHPLGPWIY